MTIAQRIALTYVIQIASLAIIVVLCKALADEIADGHIKLVILDLIAVVVNILSFHLNGRQRQILLISNRKGGGR